MTPAHRPIAFTFDYQSDLPDWPDEELVAMAAVTMDQIMSLPTTDNTWRQPLY